jgi:crotonobetainyl-CoA:carnitine CoA-transferase CaiB-like acyl-CoA transferase
VSPAASLAGIRVVELAHIMAGPICGLMLADMGADVVKVERLPAGDGTRGFMPPGGGHPRPEGVGRESPAFMMLNRGKRGVALDLRAQEGRDVVRRLAETADVLIENFRPGVMEGMGLGYDELSARNARLVYCQVTGFGRTGPLSRLGGFDLIAQGYSGLMSVTGEGPGRPPVKVAAPITDITAGILAAFGVASALVERERTGRGRRVDTSLFEAGITQTYWQSAFALATGVDPEPLGSAHPFSAPYQAFQTADGWITVGASNEGTWMRLIEVLDAPELADDPRFRTNADRITHVAALVALLEPLFRTRSSAGWLALLEESGVPAGPVASILEMLAHPQTLARRMVIDVEHSAMGTVQSLGPAVKMAGDPADGVARSRRGAPLLGEHTREVLEASGWSAGEVQELLDRGVALQA